MKWTGRCRLKGCRSRSCRTITGRAADERTVSSGRLAGCAAGKSGTGRAPQDAARSGAGRAAHSATEHDRAAQPGRHGMGTAPDVGQDQTGSGKAQNVHEAENREVPESAG